MPSSGDSSGGSGGSWLPKPQASGAKKPEENFLLKAYFAVEDQYYNVCDFLQNSGVPVYKYWVDPIESRGVPSFPVTIGVFVLLALLLWLLMQPAGLFVLTVKVSAGGKPLSGANVSLAYGGELFWHPSSTKGSAVFEGVPYGARVLLNASKQGYSPLKANYSFVVSESKSVSFEMKANFPQAIVADTLVLRAYYLDDKGKKRALEGVKAGYLSVAGAELGTVTTAADGAATLLFDGSNSVVCFKFEKKGFSPKSSGNCASFSKSVFEVEFVGESSKKSRLLVSVANENGTAVVSRVDVVPEYSSEPLKVLQTDAAGQAEFELAFGTRVFVNAEATKQADREKYSPFYGEGEAFAVDSETYNYGVVLKKRAGFGMALVRVLADSDGSAIEDAQVSIYNAASPAKGKIGRSVLTDASGAAAFDIPNNTLAYATAYKDGFLPGAALGLKVGANKEIRLRRANASNSGFVRVFVREENSSLVSGASADLFLGDFPLGLPQMVTNESGFVVFRDVPSGTDLSARAFLAKEGRTGQSAKFKAVSGQTINATVVLDPGTGTVLAQAYDAFSGKPVAGASVSASWMGNASAKCSTNSTGECVMPVRSFVAFTVNASAPGYGAYSSQELEKLALNEMRVVRLPLMDPAKKNELFSNLVKVVEDPSGADASFLERGKKYKAVFAVNFPANMASPLGFFHARLGESGTASGSDFVVTAVSAYNPLNAQLGSSFDNNSCEPDNGNAGEYKFAQVYFSNMTGPKNVEVSFFVRAADAFGGNEARLYHRVYANATVNGVSQIMRAPADDSLPTDEDACNAKANLAIIPLVPGVTKCSATHCVTVSFGNATGEYGQGFEAPINSDFRVFARTRPLDGAQALGNYKLELFHSDHSNVTAWGGLFKDQAGPGYFATSADPAMNASLNMSAKYPSLQLGASVSAIYTPGTGGNVAELQADARYTVLGRDWLNVSAQVQNADETGDASAIPLYAGMANLVALSVNDSRGMPVTNAIINFNDPDLAGTLPSTLPDITGDGSDGNGRDGIYSFQLDNPPVPGRITVIATIYPASGPDARGSVDLAVQKRPFFNVLPREAYVCNKPVNLAVENRLDVPITLNVTVSPAGCVSLLGGQPKLDEFSTADFDYFGPVQRGAGENATISITPGGDSANTACTVLFESYSGDPQDEIAFALGNALPADACRSASVPFCDLAPGVSAAVGAFGTQISADYNFVPRGIMDANMSCGPGDVTEEKLDADFVAKRGCEFPAVAETMTQAVSSAIYGTPRVFIAPEIGQCSAPITVRSPPSGIEFLVNESGIYALKDSFDLKISPLIPANAINISINNTRAIGIEVGLDASDHECLSVRDLSNVELGNAIPVGAKDKLFLALAYNSKDACIPPFYASGNEMSLDPAKLSAYNGRLTATFVGGSPATAEVKINPVAAYAGTAKYSLGRILVDTQNGHVLQSPSGNGLLAVFADNMQAPPRADSVVDLLVSTLTSDVNIVPQNFTAPYSKAVSRKLVPPAGQSFSAGEKLYMILPRGVDGPQLHFDAAASPTAGSLAEAGTVKGTIQNAYLETNSLAWQWAYNVLKLPKTTSIIVPFSATLSGTGSSIQLLRYDVTYPSDATGYQVSGGTRCAYSKAQADAGTSDSLACGNCGDAEGHPCCTSDDACMDPAAGGIRLACRANDWSCQKCGDVGKMCCSKTPECNGGNQCQSGTCVASGGPGQPCRVGGGCDPGLSCDGGTCVQPTPVPTTPGGGGGWRGYTVSCQDCLSAIAAKCLFDASRWDEICAHNGYSDCNLIHPGDAIEVPNPDAGAPSCAASCTCSATCCGSCC
ncbi:MAG: carboxypeptidase-like regulatory domain-containing protein [Candidatus Micrarchaeia archaeon]|jgi:hypothetical protein